MCSISWHDLISVAKLCTWYPVNASVRFIYWMCFLQRELHLRSWDHVVDWGRTHHIRLFLQLFGALKEISHKPKLSFFRIFIFTTEVDATFVSRKLHYECVPKLVFLETIIVVINIQLAADDIYGTIFCTSDPALLIIVVGRIFVWKINLFVLYCHAWGFGLDLHFWTTHRAELTG
jgi:hypothetical protein